MWYLWDYCSLFHVLPVQHFRALLVTPTSYATGHWFGSQLGEEVHWLTFIVDIYNFATIKFQGCTVQSKGKRIFLPVYIMMAYGGLVVRLYSFLTLAPCGSEWWAQASVFQEERIRSSSWIGGWVDRRAPEHFREKKNSLPVPEIQALFLVLPNFWILSWNFYEGQIEKKVKVIWRSW
jgi:hypothetical protein